VSTPEKVLEQHSAAIVRYDAMCRAIQVCHSVDEVKAIRDKALALEVYAAQAMNTDAERKACEIRLRAERRAGQLLKETKKNGQRAKAGDNPRGGRVLNTPKLADLGISADQSSKWQALAEVPEEQFERALRDPTTKPSTTRLIQKKNDPGPRIDPSALWIWGQLREFESERICQHRPSVLFEAMTDTMQDDVRRITPVVIGWLTELQEIA